MRLIIDVTMHYNFAQPNTVFLALEAAQTDGQDVIDAWINIGDATIDRIAGDSGVGERIWARVPGYEMYLTYHAVVDVTRPTVPLEGMQAIPLHQLPAEVAPYLRPSRYVQSDKFQSFVGKRFGHLGGGDKVAAIRDWITQNLSYVPGSSDADTNVLETFAGRQGVCRDYAHLICAMVRAAQIPARMVAAYSPGVWPPDFHALAEVWLDDAWHLVDPTAMGQPHNIAKIAVGRDAYDIAFMDSQAPAGLIYQAVSVVEG
ncbi:transglutaminase family protein [Maritimibacter sp. UBA3975]|uniref:transglutaminase-like domain-containing protein n=1 Tax=Maritimibacter sp. UBA3975 TaxID=1946833 RepID=UPI000C0B63E5|nr:transglutaminase family protein [Maritimibacter sp. UBA3975]MAM63683.1 transglutaminase [Maritimibacter sp.]|tara:strand:- start:7311 stop:8087 length:777 start_codon:yes stop_codon:yes gene_type:complete